MRRVVTLATVVAGLIMGGLPVAAAAAPGPTPSGDPAGRGARVCTITDDRLVELSGMTATGDGFVVVNDSSTQPSRKRIFYLDLQCEVTDTRPYSGNGPRDPEDMGLAPGGKTLFIADIGDNDGIRGTVSLWTMPVDGSEPPVLNRLTYPDGRHDAEALLFNGDGTPIIITRELGKAGLYSPSGPLQPGTARGVPMTKLGEVTWPRTSTPNQYLPGPLAQMVITGGATAPDGSKVVLRTYSDAFEWDVSNGDVIGALTRGRPRSTPLPGEPRGEAITYSPDGGSFLTVSEVADQPAGTRPEIRRYTPASRAAAAQPASPRADTRSWFDKLSLQDITYLIAGVGALGALLLAAGMYGMLRARRAATDNTGGNDGPGRLDGGTAAARVPAPSGSLGQLDGDHAPPGAGRVAGAAYGSPPGAIYGGQPSRGAPYGIQRGGSVYGSGAAGGGYDEQGPEATRFDDNGRRSGNELRSATGQDAPGGRPEDRLGS